MAMDHSMVVGGLLFSKLATVLLKRIQSEQHLAYHKSKNQHGQKFEDNYDQYIEGKLTNICKFLLKLSIKLILIFAYSILAHLNKTKRLFT